MRENVLKAYEENEEIPFTLVTSQFLSMNKLFIMIKKGLIPRKIFHPAINIITSSSTPLLSAVRLWKELYPKARIIDIYGFSEVGHFASREIFIDKPIPPFKIVSKQVKVSVKVNSKVFKLNKAIGMIGEMVVSGIFTFYMLKNYPSGDLIKVVSKDEFYLLGRAGERVLNIAGFKAAEVGYIKIWDIEFFNEVAMSIFKDTKGVIVLDPLKSRILIITDNKSISLKEFLSRLIAVSYTHLTLPTN